MIIYGRNPVQEAARGRRGIEHLWVTEAVSREDWVSTLAVPVEVVATNFDITDLCESTDHQGVCAEVGGFPYVHASEILADDDALVIVLDEIQDPHNLGAVCRVAECAGASGVVIPERRAAEVTPAVCKASAGAVEHLRIARVRNVTEYLNEAKKAGAWVYGAHGDSETSYDSPDYSGKVVLVLGSEGRGLRPRVIGACDVLVALPLRGQIESLNVSAAAAALVYGILQSRSRAA